tara:strand:- start:127 stop:546 length:420 start_codon:yes stop_codon:yes gene_type:complete
MSNTEPSNPFESPLSPIPRIQSEREQLPPLLQPSYETFSAIDVFPEIDRLRHLIHNIQQQQQQQPPSTRIDVLRNRGSNITDSEIEELRNIQEGESKNPNGGRKRRRRKTKKRQRRKSRKIRRNKSKKNRKRKTKKRRK